MKRFLSIDLVLYSGVLCRLRYKKLILIDVRLQSVQWRLLETYIINRLISRFSPRPSTSGVLWRLR